MKSLSKAAVFGLIAAFPAFSAHANFQLQMVSALYEDGAVKLTWMGVPIHASAWYWDVRVQRDSGGWSSGGSGLFENNFTVKNLDTSSTYRIVVQATTRVGDVADSDTLTVIPKYRPEMQLAANLIRVASGQDSAVATIENTGVYWSEYRVTSSDTSVFEFGMGDSWWPSGGGWITPKSHEDFAFRMRPGQCTSGYLAISYQLREAINPVVLTDTITVEADCSSPVRRGPIVRGKLWEPALKAYDLNGRVRKDHSLIIFQ